MRLRGSVQGRVQGREGVDEFRRVWLEGVELFCFSVLQGIYEAKRP